MPKIGFKETTFLSLWSETCDLQNRFQRSNIFFIKISDILEPQMKSLRCQPQISCHQKLRTV